MRLNDIQKILTTVDKIGIKKVCGIDDKALSSVLQGIKYNEDIIVVAKVAAKKRIKFIELYKALDKNQIRSIAKQLNVASISIYNVLVRGKWHNQSILDSVNSELRKGPIEHQHRLKQTA